MENPETRGPAAQLIADVVERHQGQLLGGLFIGSTLAKQIYDALVEEGYLQSGD